MDTQSKRAKLKSYKKNKIEIKQNTSNKQNLIKINKEIEDAIDKVKNQDERIALRYVYIDENIKTQEEAADKANFSFKYFQKILSNGVKHIKL